jgi:hypothetical protein
METTMRKLLTLWIALAASALAVLPVSAQVGFGGMFPGPGTFMTPSGGGCTAIAPRRGEPLRCRMTKYHLTVKEQK